MNKKQASMFLVALLLVIVGASPAISQGLPIYDNIPSTSILENKYCFAGLLRIY